MSGTNNRSVTLPFGLHFPERRSLSRLSNVLHENLGKNENKLNMKSDYNIKQKNKENNNFNDQKYRSTSTIVSAMTTTADSCINTSVVTRSSSSRTTSADSIPMVVLTPESPPGNDDFSDRFVYKEGRRPQRKKKLLYSPYGRDRKENKGVIVCGNVSSLVAAQFDVDMESVSTSSSSTSSSSSIISESSTEEEDVGICSLSTTTLSQGAVYLLEQGSQKPFHSTAFTTIRRNTISVSSSGSSSAEKCNPGQEDQTVEENNNMTMSLNIDGEHKGASAMLPSSVKYNEISNHETCYGGGSNLAENPFRKVFTRRKQFYQRFCEQDKTSRCMGSTETSKLIWRRHCSLCCDDKPCPNKDDLSLTHHQKHDTANKCDQNSHKINNRITLNANIEPFAPFTIHHDGISGLENRNKMIENLLSRPALEDTRSEDQNQGEEKAIPFLDVRGGNGIRTFPSFSGRRGSQLGHPGNPSGALSNCGSGEMHSNQVNINKTANEGDVIHYATSAINSEDGVESHLEVSLGKDGDTVIRTSHKLLGNSTSNSNLGLDGYGNGELSKTMSNSSVLRLQYAADGKTLNISSSQKLLPNPNVRQQTPTAPNCLNPAAYMPMLRNRPSSAYYTQQFPINPKTEELPDRYNSLPNLYGRPTNQHSDVASNLMYDVASNSPWVYQSYPADEEKRVAYTRSEIRVNLLRNSVLRDQN